MIRRLGLGLVLPLVACGGHSPAASNTEFDEIAAQIWELEDAYNDGYLTADHAAVLSIVHDGFLGWPGGEPEPADRQGFVGYLERRYSRPATWTITIERKGLRVHGELAINHYIVHARWTDAAGEEQQRSSKVTHTWLREGSQWKIIGGMSAPLE